MAAADEDNVEHRGIGGVRAAGSEVLDIIKTKKHCWRRLLAHHTNCVYPWRTAGWMCYVSFLLTMAMVPITGISRTVGVQVDVWNQNFERDVLSTGWQPRAFNPGSTSEDTSQVVVQLTDPFWYIILGGNNIYLGRTLCQYTQIYSTRWQNFGRKTPDNGPK